MFPGETVLSKQAMGLEKDTHVSDFMVMHSGAGYYIGTIYTHCGECESCVRDDLGKGFQEPNSRETEYFETYEEAEKVLKQFKDTGDMEGARSSAFNEEGAKQLVSYPIKVGPMGFVPDFELWAKQLKDEGLDKTTSIKKMMQDSQGQGNPAYLSELIDNLEKS